MHKDGFTPFLCPFPFAHIANLERKDALQTLVEISEYVAQNTRNKLVFCDHSIDELDFVDVGFELSLRLSKSSYDNDSALAAVLGQSSRHDKIGSYLAIKNIGILFEPELRLNIRDMLDSYSKNQCLIVQTEAEFLERIDLQGLSYLNI